MFDPHAQIRSNLENVKSDVLSHATKPNRIRSIENLWIILMEFLESEQGITIEKVGSYATKKFGGPRAQSIRNDLDGFAKLVHAFRLVQTEHSQPKTSPTVVRQPGRHRAEILEVVSNPRLRSYIGQMFDDLISLRKEQKLLKDLLRQATPIASGTITVTQTGLTKTDLKALQCFLDENILLQSGLKVVAGEVRTVNGRTVFGRASVSALQRIIGDDSSFDGH